MKSKNLNNKELGIHYNYYHVIQGHFNGKFILWFSEPKNILIINENKNKTKQIYNNYYNILNII